MLKMENHRLSLTAHLRRNRISSRKLLQLEKGQLLCTLSSKAVVVGLLEVLQLTFCNVKASTLGIVAELLLSHGVFGMDDLVGLADGSHGKEAVHALQRNSFGFGNEEVDKRNAENHHGGEEVVDTATCESLVRTRMA